MSYCALLNLKDILSAYICQLLCICFLQIPQVVTAIVVLSSYSLRVSWHAHKEQSYITTSEAFSLSHRSCWSEQTILFGELRWHKRKVILVGWRQRRNSHPHLYMLLSIWWMETQAGDSLSDAATPLRMIGGRAYRLYPHTGDPLGRDLDCQVVWHEIQAICRFLNWAVESCISEGDGVTPVLLNQVRMIQMNKKNSFRFKNQ